MNSTPHGSPAPSIVLARVKGPSLTILNSRICGSRLPLARLATRLELPQRMLQATCFLAACMLIFSGCGKKQTALQLTPVDISGVKVDMPRLQEAFIASPANISAQVTELLSTIRYGQYAKAVAALENLGTVPELTEPQKKVVSEVSEQMKQVVVKAGPLRQ